MENVTKDLLTLARRSITAPREAAREVLAMRLPLPIRWMALALTSILSALFLHASLKLLPPVEQEMLPGFPGPFESALAQAGLMILSAVLVHRVGRWRGGRGTFPDALILMVWLQAVLLGFQMLQIVALLFVPSITNILGVAGLVLFFWLLTSFVAELHGFESLGRVLVGIIATVVVTSILLSIVLMPFLPMGG